MDRMPKSDGLDATYFNLTLDFVPRRAEWCSALVKGPAQNSFVPKPS